MNFIHWLTLLLIGLKLTGYIDWSWWWITVGLWGQFGLILLIAVLAAFVKRG